LLLLLLRAVVGKSGWCGSEMLARQSWVDGQGSNIATWTSDGADGREESGDD
jgi:hypothetical protein